MSFSNKELNISDQESYLRKGNLKKISTYVHVNTEN